MEPYHEFRRPHPTPAKSLQKESGRAGTERQLLLTQQTEPPNGMSSVLFEGRLLFVATHLHTGSEDVALLYCKPLALTVLACLQGAATGLLLGRIGF